MTSSERFRSWIKENRFLILLAMLLILLMAAPLAPLLRRPLLVGLVINLSLSMIVVSAFFAASRGRVILIIVLCIAVIGIKGLFLWLGGTSVQMLDGVATIGFLLLMIVLTLRHVFTSQRVTSDTVAASLCVYLLLGLLFANFYSLVDILQGGAFIFPEGSTMEMRMGREHTHVPLYYSFVTLTTLGYGEITPVTAISRMLASVEAFLGPVYLAVLVARLVGVQVAQSIEERKNP